MKRFVLIGLLLIGFGTVTYAQTDDIYATGSGPKRCANE